MRSENGYLTVLMALVLAVLLGVFLAEFEMIKYEEGDFETKVATDAALESVMADYSRILFEEFNIFAVDSSYGTNYVGAENVTYRLKKYLSKNLVAKISSAFDPLELKMSNAHITGGVLLTDEGVYIKEVLKAIKSDIGFGYAEKYLEWYKDKSFGEDLSLEETEKEFGQMDESLGELVENGSVTDYRKELLTGIMSARAEGVNKLAEKDISSKTIYLPDCVSHRNNINKGNGTEEVQKLSLVEKILFSQYLLNYMNDYSDENHNSGIDYELEYILCGKDSDEKNLEGCIKKILLLRTMLNMAYLHGDEEKISEVQTLATAIAALILTPEAEPAVEEALMLGWAYMESREDARRLLHGKTVKIIKGKEDWRTSLMSALDIGEDECEETNKDFNDADYEDYLRILLLMTNSDALISRAMDVTELRIRSIGVNKNFRLDGCFTMVQAEVKTKAGKYAYICNMRKQY